MAFTGQQAHIPLADLGLLTDMAPGQIPRGALIRANNISYETGLITKCTGSRKYNSTTFGSTVVALHDWWPDTVTQRFIVACANGNLYRDIGDGNFGPDAGSTNEPMTSTALMSLDPRAMFIDGGQETSGRTKKLFLFSGTNQVKVLDADGLTFATIRDPAADWVTPNYPSIGLIHRNRLWAFMNQRAYASDSGDHEDFNTNFLTQAVFPGEGGNISGAFVFKGRLFAFKEGGFVYYLDDADTDSDNWVWRKLASNFGLSSPHGIIEVMNDMIAVNDSGSPTSYSAVQSFGDIESADLLRSLRIEDYFRGITGFSGLDVLHACYYEAKKMAFFTYRTGARSTNDTLLMIDFNSQNPRSAFWPSHAAQCLTLRRDRYKIKRPVYGGSDGFVYLADQEDRLIGFTGAGGGSAISAEFMIAHTDMRFLDERLAQKNKLFDFLDVEFKPQGSWNLEVDVYIDGQFSETINFLMDVRDDGLDSFTLGGDTLGRDESQTIRKPLHGSGRRLSFLCRNTGSNQNFAIAGFTVGFRVSAEQATRI
jgi:hypothetical protein